MRIFTVGDVVGTSGQEILREVLPEFKRRKNIDLCIVNGENAAPGNGLTPEAFNHMITSGADVITTGNHAYRRRQSYDIYDEKDYLLRPANFPERNPGKGYCRVDFGRCQVGVINLMGRTYMEPLENPFTKVDELLEELNDCKVIIVDFHAEATSEKRAMGFYLDGRASAVVGTHTHVQTADEQILPKGTGYITDLGMTGPIQSVLGVEPEIIIGKFKTGMPARFELTEGESFLNGCLFDIDDKTGSAIGVERIQLRS